MFRRFLSKNEIRNNIIIKKTHFKINKRMHSSNQLKETEMIENDKPGFFSRNPGIILGIFITGLSGYIYRGSKNRKHFEIIQNKIADESPISPYEAYQLRNSNNITIEKFKTITSNLNHYFESNHLSYPEFDAYLATQLNDICPNGLHNGYLLERVILYLPKNDDKKYNVNDLLTAFSLVVKGAASERIHALFSIISNNKNNMISKEDIEKIIESLLRTYQIPSEKRVVPIKLKKYPFQEYERASASRLLEDYIISYNKNIENGKEKIMNDRLFSVEEFSNILRSKLICVWGECFQNRVKKKNKN